MRATITVRDAGGHMKDGHEIPASMIDSSFYHAGTYDGKIATVGATNPA